jgi:regulation of enolase protein 1 (concanavalin A-like superfamily)
MDYISYCDIKFQLLNKKSNKNIRLYQIKIEITTYNDCDTYENTFYVYSSNVVNAAKFLQERLKGDFVPKDQVYIIDIKLIEEFS